MPFAVTGGGDATPQPEKPTAAEPTDEDRRKAKLLAEGGGFDADVQDFFAQGLAVARNGGDVEAFVRAQLGRRS